MSYKVFIDGREGTTGLKIFERLEGREDIKLLLLSEEDRKNAKLRREMINNADIVFLCLPDEAAVESVSLCENNKTRIIDASTAHRTKEGWTYGFPELSEAHRNAVKNAKRLCVPGCHATGFISLVYPLVSMRIMPASYPFVCHSVTGYSGGGKNMIAEYENTDRKSALSSPRQYGLSLSHKHLPEMKKVCGLAKLPIFNPIVADFYCGMAVTVPIFTDMLKKKLTARDAHKFFSHYYKNQRFIKVAPFMGEGILEGGFLEANKLSGTNELELFVCGNDEQILLICRFDNLGKGASGAAVQCMNIMLGLDEAFGL